MGEHNAVVWNWLYRSPFFATRSSAGVGTGPPNVPHVPKPTSSSNTNTIFGAPVGACVVGNGLNVESAIVRPITPLNGGVAVGSDEPTGLLKMQNLHYQLPNEFGQS